MKIDLMSAEDPTANGSKIDLTVDPQRVPMPDEIAGVRSEKANYAMGETSPGKDVLYDGIRSGSEIDLRTQTALAEDSRDALTRAGLIRYLASRKGGPLDDQEEAMIRGIATPRAADPETIWEKLFARKYSSDVAQGIQERPDGAYKDPDKFAGVLDMADGYSGAAETMEYFRTLKEDLSARDAASSWLGTAWDFTKTAIPLYNEWKMWNPNLSGVLWGSQMRSEVRHVWSLPINERKEYVKEKVNRLYGDNRFLANEYLNALISFPATDEFMGNVSTLSNAALFGPARGAKAAKEAAGAAEAGGRMMTPGEITRASAGSGAIKRQSELDRTVTQPRSMTTQELMKAADGLGLETPNGPLTPSDVLQLRAKVDEMFPQGDVTHYRTTAGEFPVRPAEGKVIYMTPENAQRITGRLSDQWRLTERQDGYILATRNGKNWEFPEGSAVIPRATEPREGFVPVTLSGEKKLMGSTVYNDVKIGDPVIGLSRRAAEATEGRFMGLRDLEGIRDGLPGRKLTTEEIADLDTAMGDMLKALSQPTFKMENVLETNGKIGSAAAVRVSKDVMDEVSGLAGRSDMQDLALSMRQRLPSIFQPNQMVTDIGSYSREAAQRIYDKLHKNSVFALEALNKTPRVSRLTPEALNKAFQIAEADVRKQFSTDQANAVFDVIRNLDKNNWANSNTITVKIGKVDGNLFDTREQAAIARRDIYKLGDEGADILQKGDKYYLAVTRPVDETAQGVRDLLIQTGNKTPVTMANYWLGYLRSANDKLSALHNENRLLVQHAQSEAQEYMKFLASDLRGKVGPGQGLSRSEHADLKRVFEKNRQDMEYYETLGDFEQGYRMLNGKMPSEAAAKAYFANVQLNDFNYMTLNLGFSRDLTRQGIEQVRLVLPTVGDAATMQTSFFYGKEVQELPRLDKSFGVVLWQDGRGRVIRSSSMTADDKKAIEAAQAGGHKIVQIANPLERPLGEFFGSEMINYAIVKDFERKKLDWSLIPYNPGGHKEYAVGNYVKQAIFSKAGTQTLYEGDVTVLGFETRAEAIKYSKLLNEARDLLKNDKHDELRQFLNKNLPQEFAYDKFIERFKSQNGKPPQWSIEDDFAVTQAGRNLADEDKGLLNRMNASNETNSPYNLFGNVNKKFLGSRDEDVWTIKEFGSEQQPQIRLDSARLIDPYLTLNRSVSSGLHSLLANDYRTFALDSWVQEFWQTLAVEGKNAKAMVESNPLWYIQNGKFDEGFADALTLSAAKRSRQAVMDFLGIDAKEVVEVKNMQQRILSGVYETFGQKTSDMLSGSQLMTVKDPFTYARNVAFDLKLGLFNPIQLPLQAAAAMHGVFVAGASHGLPGIYAATLAQMLRMTEDPKIIDRFAKMATGWKPEHFKEALEQGKRSGWFNVAGEVAWRDDIADPTLIGTPFGRFLDFSRVFFREGERVSRTSGWFIAYHEWRGKNPTRAFDDKALAEVLSRADTFNVNMTRASSAEWQTGLASVPTQFMSFSARLMEQMTSGGLGNSGRLTRAEKLRVMTGYSALYGIPLGTGTAVAVWPVYESARTYALEQGIDLQNPYWKVAMEGIPSFLLSAATGQDYNLASRMGPGSASPLRDYWLGQKGLGEIAVGAAGTTAADVAKTIVGPALMGISTALFGGKESYPLTGNDFRNIARNITTINNLDKAFYAWNTGKYFSKQEGIIADDMTNMDAIFMAFGLTRQDIMDSWRMSASQKSLKAAQDNAEKQAMLNIRLAIQSAKDNDEKQSQDYMSRAKAWITAGDFQASQAAAIMEKVNSELAPFKDKIRLDFNWTRAPQSRFERNFK